jgi:glutathione S-transferase
MMGALKTGVEKDPDAIKPLFTVLDVPLQKGLYILGDLTVVDFAIGAYLMTKMARQFDYSGHPRVAEWLQRVEKLKGFVATQVRLPPSVS